METNERTKETNTEVAVYDGTRECIG